jgi:hypothetical protein
MGATYSIIPRKTRGGITFFEVFGLQHEPELVIAVGVPNSCPQGEN